MEYPPHRLASTFPTANTPSYFTALTIGTLLSDRRIHRTCPHTSHVVAWIPGREEGYNEGIEAAWLVVTQ